MRLFDPIPLVLILFLIPISIIDIKQMRIPDLLNGGAFLIILSLQLFYQNNLYFPVIDFSIGLLFFFLIWYFSKGGIGLGDVKLSGVIALALGLEGWLFSLMFASFLALFFALFLQLRGKDLRALKIPFAPFLGLGCFLYILTS